MSSVTVEHIQPYCERRVVVHHSAEKAEGQYTVRQTLTAHLGFVRRLIVVTVILLSFITGLLMPYITRGVELSSSEWQSNLPSAISSDSNVSEAAVGAGQIWNEAK